MNTVVSLLIFLAFYSCCAFLVYGEWKRNKAKRDLLNKQAQVCDRVIAILDSKGDL